MATTKSTFKLFASFLAKSLVLLPGTGGGVLLAGGGGDQES